MPTLNIPAPLRSYTEGTRVIDLHAADVAGALKELAAKYPALYPIYSLMRAN